MLLFLSHVRIVVEFPTNRRHSDILFFQRNFGEFRGQIVEVVNSARSICFELIGTHCMFFEIGNSLHCLGFMIQ